MRKCYFCESSDVKNSPSQRAIWYDNEMYRFVRCSECHGFSLFPKLTHSQLSLLYSSDYVDSVDFESTNVEQIDNTKFTQLKEFFRSLKEVKGKSFLDYGCGADPISFKFARDADLIPMGMELSQDVREIAKRNTGVEMLSRDEVMRGDISFDFVFLGDVLEHLIDPIIELESLKVIMSKNSLLIAQGPLQGSQTLTHLLVRTFAWLTQGRTTSYPPYHVSLASSQSMRQLFSTAGFQVERLDTFEVDWPAPTFEEVKSNLSPRGLLLFFAKQIDKFISRLYRPYGSRYFVVCSKIGDRIGFE